MRVAVASGRSTTLPRMSGDEPRWEGPPPAGSCWASPKVGGVCAKCKHTDPTYDDFWIA